ncbi:hypothetical protein [Blastococcus sp. CT_GayMR16]|uniref:hypothetical protein n=1 Tax=Blastococcus sp. CT_GayMR16 TaxID=2559607 RepID=UPI001431B730|nr:hypothetical protein [Blastococcus sp. CT_GayMR16]
MNNRKALTRHTRRANPAGIPAADLLAEHSPAPAPVVVHLETRPLLLPGLRPALTGGAA